MKRAYHLTTEQFDFLAGIANACGKSLDDSKKANRQSDSSRQSSHYRQSSRRISAR